MDTSPQQELGSGYQQLELKSMVNCRLVLLSWCLVAASMIDVLLSYLYGGHNVTDLQFRVYYLPFHLRQDRLSSPM